MRERCSPGPREPAQRRRSAPVNERRQALREYLTDSGYEALFDHIQDEIRELLPERGVWEEPGRKGVGFQLTERNVPGGWKTYC